jgi:hypothetical protein
MPKPMITSIKIMNKLTVAKSFTILFIQGFLLVSVNVSNSYAKDKEEQK